VRSTRHAPDSVELLMIKTHHSLRPHTQLDDEENGMPDKKLIILVALLIVLNFGHDAHHIARGDLRWPLTVESAPPIIIILAIFSILVFGLYFYLKNKVGCSGRSSRAPARHSVGWRISVRSRSKLHNTFTTPTQHPPPVGWPWLGSSRSCLI
jgi:hypothetical protein